MRTYTASGIVLRRIDLGEKDRILTVFAKEHGKALCSRQRLARPGSRLSGASEPFTYSKMFLATGRDLDVFEPGDVRNAFPTSRRPWRQLLMPSTCSNWLTASPRSASPTPSSSTPS